MVISGRVMRLPDSSRTSVGIVELGRSLPKNTTKVIKDTRKDLGNSGLSYVIATSGMDAPRDGRAGFLDKSIESVQIAVSRKFKYGTAEPKRHFQKQKPPRQKSDWHTFAGSYLLVGDASARAMIKSLKDR